MVLAEAVRTEDKTTLGRAALCSGTRHARGWCAEGAVRQVFPWGVNMRFLGKVVGQIVPKPLKGKIQNKLRSNYWNSPGLNLWASSTKSLCRTYSEKVRKKHQTESSLYAIVPIVTVIIVWKVLPWYQTSPCSATQSPQRWRLFHVCPRCCFRRGWWSLRGWAAGCLVAASPACSKMAVNKR